MDGFTLWLVSSISMWALGEGLNCSFPYHDGEDENAGLICQWEFEDFYYDKMEGEWILIPDDPNDNWIEAISRKRYWSKRVEL